MLKGYYLYTEQKSVGVEKKIAMQLHEFNKHFNVQAIIVKRKFKHTLIQKLIERLPNKSIFDYDSVFEQLQQPDFLYIRKISAEAGLINFLSRVKKAFPNCKIVIEIFTYPYYKDDFNRNFLHKILTYPFYLKDIKFRKQYYNFVNRFVTYSDDDYIFDVPTIRTTNGVDVKNIVLADATQYINNAINIISVAHMQPHHAFERLIKGLYLYYEKSPERKVTYAIVGDGKEVSYYKKLVNDYKLNNVVSFYGLKSGKELNDIYNHATIALSSLGLYKLDINNISPLKVYEYLSRGLPVISGCKINILNEVKCPYIFEVSNNNSAIDVMQIIKFQDEIYTSETTVKNLREKIRLFAHKNADMSIVMQPIIDYILK